MIKIGIIEDNKDLRSNYAEFLEMSGQYSVVWMYDGIEDLIDAKAEIPQVILLDINLVGMSGVVGFPLLNNRYPLTHIIVLSAYNNEEYVKELLRKGASGYILKSASMAEILKAIEAVIEGGFSISPNAARHLVAEFRHNPIEDLQVKLTKREYELVQLLAEGLSYKEAADRLFVTTFTINQHLKHIYSKLGIKSKAELMAKMIK